MIDVMIKKSYKNKEIAAMKFWIDKSGDKVLGSNIKQIRKKMIRASATRRFSYNFLSKLLLGTSIASTIATFFSFSKFAKNYDLRRQSIEDIELYKRKLRRFGAEFVDLEVEKLKEKIAASRHKTGVWFARFLL